MSEGTRDPAGRSSTAPGSPNAPGIARLIRPHLRDVEPYVTARSQHLGGILLDANENAFGTLVPELDPELHRYPDPSNRELKRAIERELDVPSTGGLWVGNGSDEVIDVLLRTLVDPGEPVVVAVPTYGVYGARARAHAAEVREVRLDDGFDLDVEGILDRAEDAKLVLLCSPNNPTGNRLSASRILEIAERSPALVAVDEAYVEFSRDPSLASRAGDPPHLAVIRTFSKAWGLAGARVGWLAGHPELIRWMDRSGLPYPLSSPARSAALEALERCQEMRDRVRSIRQERSRLREALEGMGLEVAPSDANFLLFFVEEPGRVQRRLAEEHGVVIRNRSGLPGLEGALRVTVGTPEENDAFLDGLRRVREDPS